MLEVAGILPLLCHYGVRPRYTILSWLSNTLTIMPSELIVHSIQAPRGHNAKPAVAAASSSQCESARDAGQTWSLCATARLPCHRRPTPPPPGSATPGRSPCPGCLDPRLGGPPYSPSARDASRPSSGCTT